MSVKDLPVLIVGCGPAGILASLLLTELKIRHKVVEERSALHLLPQAHVVKLRTMEILRQLGLEQEVLKQATPTEFQKYVTWRDTLAGMVFGKISMVGRKGITDKLQIISPTYTANIPQNTFEKILFDQAVTSEFSEFVFDTRCLEVCQDERSAIATIENLAGEKTIVEAEFVIAADGVASAIRRKLGYKFEGDTSLEKFITIIGDADLSELVADCPGVLHWIRSPSCTGVFIIHNVKNCFAFLHPYDDSVTTPADFTKEVCSDILRKAMGKEIPFSIVGIDNWNMSAQVAESYGTGRIYLVGDAAHRFPPTGGMGLNTGAQDVYNLVWKIGLVLEGNASSKLLDTYEQECKGVAQINCRHSKSNHLKMSEVDDVLFNGKGNLSVDRLAYLSSGSDAADAALQEVQTSIDNQLEHFDTTALDLGYQYQSCAVIEDASQKLDEEGVTYEYRQFCRSGYRFPHLQLSRDGDPISSMDLQQYSSFTLFCNAGSEWPEVVDECALELQVPIRIVTIGPNGDVQDLLGEWKKLSAVSLRGAVLVRPDGQVAWRCVDGQNGSDQSLEVVMSAILQVNTAMNCSEGGR